MLKIIERKCYHPLFFFDRYNYNHFLIIWLQNLEEMLTCFQSELGTVSSDMKRLQQQSIDISLQLQNNQKVRGELSQFVDDMVVPVNMIKFVFLKY